MDQLAQPKPNRLKYPDRSVYWLDELPLASKGSTTTFRSPAWQVTAATLQASPSERVCHLAIPRPPTVGWQPDRPLLATPKSDHPEHQQDRPVLWAVPKSALCGAPSERIQVLAQPKQRRALFEGHDPYRVSPAALYGTASLRLLQLSAPLPRKCKNK
uniref:Sperm microtubule associated protein 2 n=1 Tax=Paramormyrops kingsleyae TaxID=1676925 RepID=A0A3B3S7Z6_9TELE